MFDLPAKHFIADSHCDTIWWMDQQGYNFKQLNVQAHIDLPRLLAGKVDLLYFAVCTAPYGNLGTHLSRSINYIRLYHQNLQQNKEHLLTIETGNDLEQAGRENKIACLLSLEGAEPLEDCPDNLEVFFKLGVRCLSLTWNKRNMFADGVGEETAGSGLTSLGRRLIEKMSELGIILDLAHLSTRCFYEALDQAKLPPLVTHTNSRTLCDHSRNLTDEQVKALAERDGVLGLSFNAPFITGKTSASLDQLLDHFVHFAGIVGVSHLAVGSDFDGIKYPVEELRDASCYGRLIEALYGRGFSSQEVDLITGGNLRRIIKANLNEQP
ncbi:MAG TPA: membrane dipeptidase [Firmicutes bacterium]|nr:membrane dipeptidase [Bacillota bacterium]